MSTVINNTMSNTNAFDSTRAIVFSRGSRSSKIERLVKEEKYDLMQANRIYDLMMAAESELRASNTPYRFTMGVEIECFNLHRDALLLALQSAGVKVANTGYSHTNSADTYKLSSDSTIDGSNPVELVSPILKDLKSLKTTCEVINEAGAKVNKSCGLHVHLGASKMTGKDWRNIVVNYANIEHLIDSFMAPSRRTGNIWCKTVKRGAEIVKTLSDDCTKDMVMHCFDDRYYKVNTHTRVHGHDTIEFRQHQGSTDFVKIEAWVKFLTAFVDWSMKHNEFISARTIDELPFLNASQKRYFNQRASEFATREGRA